MENEIVQFLLAHGYFIMFVLMIVEGPIVTLAATFLASLGYFSLPGVFFISLLGDICGDLFWYCLGRRYGMRFVCGPGRYIGMSESMVNRMRGFFRQYGGKTIFAVKSTTGLCLVTFVAAGVVRMDLRKFLLFSLLGGIVWSATLVGVGYVFGYLYEEIALYISWAGWIIAGLAIVFFVGINVHKKRQARIFLQSSKN